MLPRIINLLKYFLFQPLVLPRECEGWNRRVNSQAKRQDRKGQPIPRQQEVKEETIEN
jgi:hypothetical protein